MEYHKKFGMIVMVSSIALALLLIIVSKSPCSPDLAFGTWWLEHCLWLQFFGDEYSAQIRFPTKYALMVCIFGFAAGFLWYTDAIKAPSISKAAKSIANFLKVD